MSRVSNFVCATAVLLAAPVAAQDAGRPAPTADPARPSPSPQQIPADALAALPFIQQPRLSPDGLHLAARMTAQGKNWIAIYDLRLNLAEQRPMMVEWGDYDVTWMRWAGNNRILFGIRMLRPIPAFDMEVPVSRAGSIDLRTGQTTPLLAGGGIDGDNVIFVDPNGEFILLSAPDSLLDYPSVERIDLATGRRSAVQSSREGVWDWFADAQGVVRVGVDYGERRTRIYYRAGAAQDLRRIDLRNAPASGGAVGASDGIVIDAIHFTPTAAGDRAYVVSNEATGRFGVYEYDFATGARGAAVYENGEYDVDGLRMGNDGGLLGVTYQDDRDRTHWIDENMRRIQGKFDRALPGKMNVILSWSSDFNKFLVWSSAADDPGTYLLYDRVARQMHGFASPYAQLASFRFAPMRTVSYRSRDGLAIPAYLTLPPGRAERGLPLIVMPHGGPFDRDVWAFDSWVQFLASRGYAVLQPNFRGSTGYGRQYVERGIGQWGTGMIDDLEDGVRWLAGEGTIDPRRVCIMGGSYGGYAAMWAPIRHPETYRCAVSFAGISDVRAMLRYDGRVGAATRYSRVWRARVQGNQADLAAISPLQQVAQLRVPLLIAHGDKDRNVPPSQSRNLVRALARAGTDVESVFYPQAVHGFTRPEDSVDFLRRVEAFLARHNPAQTPAPAPAAP